MGERRGIDRKKVGCRSLIDANLEGQVGVNKFKLNYSGHQTLYVISISHIIYVNLDTSYAVI